MIRAPNPPTDTVLDRFPAAARDEPDRPIFISVDGKGRDREVLTYAGFMDAISVVGEYLVGLGIRRGDRVLMVYPPSLDFVTAFVAALAVGVVPVPVAPPNPFKLGRDLAAFEAIAASSGSTAVLTNKSYWRSRRLASAQGRSPGRDGAWSLLPWYRTDAARGSGAQFRLNPVGPGEAAFLQYTSGSTSVPRGVMISHANITHQLTTNAGDLGLDRTSRAVLWLPHFHDFCLVSGILSAVHGNGTLHLMSPLTFLRRPHLWFDVLSRVRATHTAAPDFAYRLAARRTTPEQRRKWDLSNLRVVMSAGEPIRRSTVDEFLSAFGEAKLDPAAFGPAYGLAEHTVGISTSGRRRLTLERVRFEDEGEVVPTSGAETSSTLTLFGCGAPSPSVDVRIVDPDTAREVEPGSVGEIWVDSPSKALGYFGLPDASREQFEAILEGSAEGKGYLKTGDLGFFHDGEIFVTGRCKDLIIVRGRNIYPQDIEESAYSSHPLVRPGRAVAFPMSGPEREGESIVVLLEMHKKKASATELDEVVHAVRARVVSDHHVVCDEVVVAEPGVILKTSSGKLRRNDCRKAYQSGRLAGRLLRVDTSHH